MRYIDKVVAKDKCLLPACQAEDRCLRRQPFLCHDGLPILSSDSGKPGMSEHRSCNKDTDCKVVRAFRPVSFGRFGMDPELLEGVEGCGVYPQRGERRHEDNRHQARRQDAGRHPDHRRIPAPGRHRPPTRPHLWGISRGYQTTRTATRQVTEKRMEFEVKPRVTDIGRHKG